MPVIATRQDEGVSFALEEEYEQALGTATEEELVDLAGDLTISLKESLAVLTEESRMIISLSFIHINRTADGNVAKFFFPLSM